MFELMDSQKKSRYDVTRPPNLRIPQQKEEQKVQSGTASTAHLSPLRKKNDAVEQTIDAQLQKNCIGWAQIRCRAPLPERRSYHTLNIVDNILILYGGFDISEGDRGSMYILDLCAQEPVWTRVELKTSEVPSSLCRHTAVIYDKQLWVLGGEHNYEPVNCFFAIHLETFEVKNFKPKKRAKFKGLIQDTRETKEISPPSSLDSHTAVVLEETKNSEEARMFVFGGYKHSVCSHTLYIYNFAIDEWKLADKKGPWPCARAGHASVVWKNYMYIVGGIDADSTKLNDIWRLEVDSLKWERVKPEKTNKYPPSRSGHGAVVSNDHLFIFGGIHGMTHQLNDLWAFNLHTNRWHQVHNLIDTWKLHTPIKDRLEVNPVDQSQNLSHAHSHTTFGIKPGHTRGRTLGAFDSGTSGTGSRFGDPSPKHLKQSKSQEPMGTLFQKSKLFRKHGKKGTMIDLTYLINAVCDSKSIETALTSPTTLALKNSLLFRSSELGLHPFLSTSEGASTSTFKRKARFQLYQGPKQPDTGLIEGFPPCPRDGVSLALNPQTNCFYVFGGDRHQMAYNDLYEFDLGARQLD